MRMLIREYEKQKEKEKGWEWDVAGVLNFAIPLPFFITVFKLTGICVKLKHAHLIKSKIRFLRDYG